MTPRAAYRLQFNRDFRFEHATDIAPYLATLGISHVYASPYLKARPDSPHGYDIVDHHALNPELGDEAAFARMNAAFAANGLGQILDFVPNHMGVGGADNPLWLDVLEWGPDSPYAGWFDIDWDPGRRYLHDKLLVPLLGDQYGVVLEAGQLVLKFDHSEGSFAVWAYDTHKLPISPLHYDTILGSEHAELERIGDAFSALPERRPQIARRAAELKSALAALARDNEDVQQAIAAALAYFNDPASWRALDGLIAVQHWRVAHFRVAGDDINYRRFFNINDLAGIRMELSEVFDHAHEFILRLLREGILDGLRIDHIDGLLDPGAYLRRLREAGGPDFYLVVEKILAHHESPREDWPVQGTTGYEFANQVLAFLINPASESEFARIYADFAGETDPFAAIVQTCKRRVMENDMASELRTLARDAARLARQNPRTADFTRNILQRALKEIVACFPVYRTYLDTEGTPTAEDRRDLDWALAQARRGEPNLDASVFDFLAQLLSGDLVAAPHSGFSRHAALRCAMKLQQYSGPVMAKGLEDTAFYRYHRFLALNEVGGHPDQFGTTLAAFHRSNQLRAQRWPHAMLGTSTHDTKRGEDVRARLAVLSELPAEWARNVETWSRLLRARRGDIEGTAPPDRNDEYMLYQLLAGSWPPDLLEHPSPEAIAPYAERISTTLTKSLREARRHSSWAAPDAAYEQAMLDFAALALDPTRAAAFLASFLPFTERIARLGAHNTLVQTVLKLTLPGIPDLYQGSELWDLSLVDPDNRRPVDYPTRRAGLSSPRPIPTLLQHWQDGCFKLETIRRLLQFRRSQPELFAAGEYEPLHAEGPDADRVFAFSRRHNTALLLVAVTRFPARGMPDAVLPLPPGCRDLLTGRIACRGALFADLPAAVLVTG